MSQRNLWKLNDSNGPPFLSDDSGKELKCDECKDESLYHDSFAYFNSVTSRLLCESCYAKQSPTGYVKVVTFH
jgi:hypothetical protein